MFSVAPWIFAVCLTAVNAGATQQAPVALRSASTFAILSGSAVTVTGGGTITGNIGISPFSGYTPGSAVNGTVYTGGPIAAQAQADLALAYNDAAGRQTPDAVFSGVAVDISGETLTPGLYKSGSELDIASADLILDAQGNQNAVFIFQVASALNVSAGRQVILRGNAQASNIYWQVGSSATLGSGSVMHGNILALTAITLNVGATLDGRALAMNAAVTLSTNGANGVTLPVAPRLVFTVTPGIVSSVNLSGLGSVGARGAALDSSSNLYIVDSPHNRVIKVDPSGNASLVTISGQTLAAPSGIAVDIAGNLDIVDTGNNRIVQVSASGSATVITPNNGLTLSAPTAIAISAEGAIYVADTGHGRVVEIPLSSTSSLVSTSTTLIQPVGLAFDTAGNLFIADRGTNSILKAVPAGTSSLFASGLTLSSPAGLWTDSAKNVYVADSVLNKVFRISAAGTPTLLAGTGVSGDSGDGGVATSATLNAPTAVAVAFDGTVYVTDTQALRKISPNEVFSTTNVGATATQNISVSNIGNVPYTFGSSLTFGHSPSAFSLVNTGTGDCSALVSGSFGSALSCNLQIQFAPAATPTYTDTLTLAPGLQILLTGIGVPAAVPSNPGAPANALALSAAALNLGSQFIGASGVAQTFTLHDNGPNTLNISSFTETGTNPADFSVTSNCGSMLSSGATCTASVVFTPTTIGTESAALTFTDADPVAGASYSQTIPLTGVGVPVAVPSNPGAPANALALSAAALNLGSQFIGASGVAQTFTLHDNGPNTLNISSFTETGTNPADFSVTSNCGSTLTFGATCTASVVFTPTTIGIESAALAFTDTDPVAGSSYSQTVALTGTGTAPVVSGPAVPSAPIVSLVSQFTGGSAAGQTLTVTNTGLDTLIISNLAVTGRNAADFTPTPNCAGTLGSAATCLIGIVFRPSVIGNEVASLVLTYSDSVTGISYTQIVPLTGAGLSGVPNGIVEILNRNSGKALDVLLLSTTNGASLQQYDYLGGSNQKWQLISDGNGYYKIVSVNGGKVLDVTAASTSNGAKIQQWQDLGTDNQKWVVTQLPDGSFTIANKLSGKLLDVTALSQTDGAPIQQWESTGADNQQWNIVAATFFTVTNKLSGKVLDVTGVSRQDGALIQQWDSLGGANQQWMFVPLGNGYFQVLNRNSGKALDAIDPSGIAAPPGTLVQQFSYFGRDNQQWQLIPTGNGYFEIANKSSGDVLDVTAYSLSNGAVVQLWNYLGGGNQQWRLDAVQ